MIKLEQMVAEAEIRRLSKDISESIDKYNILIESNINEAAGELLQYIITKIAQLFLAIVNLLKKFKQITDKVVLTILSTGNKIVAFMAKFKSKYPNLYSAIKILLIIVVVFAIFMLLSSTSQAATGDGNDKVEKIINASIGYIKEWSNTMDPNKADYFDKSDIAGRAMDYLLQAKDMLQSGDSVQNISAKLNSSFTAYNDVAYKIADTAMNSMNTDPEKFSKFLDVWNSMKDTVFGNLIVK